jgi:uncharacterized protein YecE (DUF72 family)
MPRARTLRADFHNEALLPAEAGWSGGKSGLRVGISGWTYPPWRGTFFPEGLRQSDELAYASRHVNSIEINGTFYSLQRPESYSSWYAQTPDDFVFSVKAPRFITHIKRLKEAKTPLANFFASGPLWLREKLGPFLWQLPPSFVFDPERLEKFFAMLPRCTREAASMAKRHDFHARHVGWPSPPPERRLRHAIEIRHHSFQTPDFIRLLRSHEIALVVADTAGKWPALEDVTADFVYVRLHGDSELYVSGYTGSALDVWASKIRAWNEGKSPPGPRLEATAPPARKKSREVYIYFDNDVKVRAPFDAMNLAHRLGIGPKARPFPRRGGGSVTARARWPEYPTRGKRSRRLSAASPSGAALG